MVQQRTNVQKHRGPNSNSLSSAVATMPIGHALHLVVREQSWRNLTDAFPDMVIEKQNGNALVHLGPKLWAYPEELIRQHQSHNGHMEYLIRWNVSENGTSRSAGASFTETRIENILMWMSADDVYANCPMLLGKRNPKEHQVEEEVSSTFVPDVLLDETSLLEMKIDVKNLVQRAAWQMASTTVPQSSILNTINVLSAYASISSLMNVFKETGALDLLLKMLSSEEKQIRRSASKMLRALASHDAGSRAYVLLSLSQQDGIERHMDFDSCYTLLELFAETSLEEHSLSFEGIPLPQIPGKLLFSLVKRYLCATSLMDKLNSTSEMRNETEDPSSNFVGKKRIQCEFDFSMAMANLISELVQVLGWNRRWDFQSIKEKKLRRVQSIFQSQIPTSTTVQSTAYLPQKETSNFKMRSAFPSRSIYVEYVQEKLVRGMRVRMLEDYEKVRAGDMGEFLQSNNGTPPVQVYWESLNHTYWVYWHMIEIAGSSSQTEQKAQEKLSRLKETLKQDAARQTQYCKTHQGLYSPPYLTDKMEENSGILSRGEWWELLFFLRKLESQKQKDIVQFIQQNQKLSQLDEEDLIQLSVSAELAQKVLQLLSKQCQGCIQRDLQSSHVYLKYSFSKEQMKQSWTNVTMIPGVCGVPSEAMISKNTNKQSFSPDVSSIPSSVTEKTDIQLMKELLKMEEPSFPGTLNEKAKAFCSVKVAGKKCVLEQVADALEMIQKSSGDIELQMAGLQFISKTLEEELGQEKRNIQATKAEGKLTIREKIVKMLVELLSHQVKEKLFVLLVLQILYVLLPKYDLRMLFATKGGLHCMLQCMQEHSVSVLVQQIGLAVMKVLLGTGNWEAPGTSGKPYPLNYSDAQEIFASIDSDSSKDSNSLLCAIPAALEKMLGIPGGSSAVQNGLLVLNMLIKYQKDIAEELGKNGIHAVLQSCCHAGQTSNKMLAQIVLSRLAEHKVLQNQESADSSVSFDLKNIDVTMLLTDLCKNNISKKMVVALERCLCSKDACFEDSGYEVLADVLLLKDLALLGSEKDVQLGALRLLSKFLDSAQEDIIPWHECIEPCLSAVSAHINDQEVVQEFIGFLHRLATLSKDYTVMMCCMGTKETLTKVLEKHGSGLLLVTELRDHLRDCEKYACLYKKMTASVLAGCIQMVLGQIEEHRRSHQPINIPFFDVFLRSLCHGLSVEVKEDNCWERVEVSSNPHWASKLMDGNPKTYWESNGNTGSHYINVYMRHDVIVKQMSIMVASEDSSYMPAQIIVMGGESTSSINTKLNVVAVPSSASRVILLENMSCFWPIIQIKIKRCHQSGIDARVHGLEVLGPKPTFWPVFKEQLCRRTYLFYTTKAHTWCQEISEDRMQLLQLFNRLNSTLRHEQMFANCFLPNNEAAQALGKTCWEALINPLVQSITSPDSSGISPLSWLLSQYLKNLEAGQSIKSQATIFNSRVRRLSHLLVHVDSRNSEPEKLKPPVKPDWKNGNNKELTYGATKLAVMKPNSMMDIMQCWKGVVQQQVKQFLESSWQAPDFVERYCNTYLHLRTAMEELFGQQMSFMLALRQGFSGALQQLSFLTAIHVSKQFACYINQWIQETWVDSGKIGTLKHLQQSLEPILFLSGLEVANTFEHFYRYYLGDRLLSQGKTWLESAVVEHIGLCFPNRFPQQMLKNLSELEEQQQQFHFFQLQQVDQHLLELDQDGKCEKGELMKEPCSQEEVEVNVLVLSPQCWTISPLYYLEEPARFFPSSLNQHLGKFADFYLQSQSHFGLELTKPRRLQWTWLGQAELEYQGCILHVSTLQMYILLCFNCSEEVFVKNLLQSSGLPPVLLNYALKPLTKENGILSQSQGALRLNERILACLSGQHLWLLPNQTYLNVEDDESKVLEKRRNAICSLIIQTLKKEKTMHIDNLVFRVVEACQKLKPGAAVKVLSFCCSSTDVLACILHLLNKGCIQCKEDQPQLLQYVSTECPTLALPKNQSQVAFQTVQIKKLPSAPCTEKRQTFSTFR